MKLESKKNNTIEELSWRSDSRDIGQDAWRTMRIQSEVVEGFETFRTLGPTVSVFGSARMNSENQACDWAHMIGAALSVAGVNVMTGGGGGVMEAANKGAQSGAGLSIGLNVELPKEQLPNRFQDVAMEYRYFFIRKLMFVRYAFAYIFLPGGFGTLDELMTVMTLLQTNKMEPAPVILVGKEHWQGLVGWIDQTLQSQGFISASDQKIFQLVDEPMEAVSIVTDYLKSFQTIN